MNNNKPIILLSIYNLLNTNIKNTITSNVNIIDDSNYNIKAPSELSLEKQEQIKNRILSQYK